jgi:hypothetical protein
VKEAIIAYFDVCGIRLEGLGKTTKNLSEHSWFPDRDLKEAGVVITSFHSKGIITVKDSDKYREIGIAKFAFELSKP